MPKTLPPALLLLTLVVMVGWFFTRGNNPPLENANKQSPPAEIASQKVTTIPRPPEPLYTFGESSRDGIGKFYLGREISFVMGHMAINWLERGSRESEEHPTKLVDSLGLKPDSVVADIGAGSGYFTFRMARKVPGGKVLAVDIQQEMLDFLGRRQQELGLSNVETVLGVEDDTRLPAGEVDLALFVDAYHEFSHPYEMMRSIHRALKPGGRAVLIEYRAEDPNVPIKPLHKMTETQAKKEMAAVGLEWVETLDFLPWQHFMVFEKP